MDRALKCPPGVWEVPAFGVVKKNWIYAQRTCSPAEGSGEGTRTSALVGKVTDYSNGQIEGAIVLYTCMLLFLYQDVLT